MPLTGKLRRAAGLIAPVTGAIDPALGAKVSRDSSVGGQIASRYHFEGGRSAFQTVYWANLESAMPLQDRAARETG